MPKTQQKRRERVYRHIKDNPNDFTFISKLTANDFVTLINEGSVNEVETVLRHRSELANVTNCHGVSPLAQALTKRVHGVLTKVELLLKYQADPLQESCIRGETTTPIQYIIKQMGTVESKLTKKYLNYYNCLNNAISEQHMLLNATLEHLMTEVEDNIMLEQFMTNEESNTTSEQFMSEVENNSMFGKLTAILDNSTVSDKMDEDFNRKVFTKEFANDIENIVEEPKAGTTACKFR